MKTKEIRVEMSRHDLDNFLTTHAGISVYKDGHTCGDGRQVKAILVIDLPKKEISLAESEFDEAVQSLKDEGEIMLLYSHRRFRDLLKKKLFSKE